MIIEKSKELLEKLRRTNYKRIPDFGMDEESEMIIKVIINECKSTLAFQDQDGEVTFERYGSDIIKENIEQIVRQLILNGVNIPRETMKNIMCSNNEFITGIDADIPLYKGIQEQEDGSMNRVATTGNVIIDFSKLDNNIVDMIKKEVYDRYARCFILDNKEKLPHLNKVSIFKERVFHGRENKEFINRKFSSLLKRQTNYNDEIIKNTVKYHLENLYSDNITKIVPESMNDMVLGVVEEVYSKSIGTISISIIFTIWSAGKGLFALTSGLQNVYKIHTEKHVSYLYLRLKVFIETIIFIILIVLGLTLLVFGDSLKYIIQQQLEGIKNYNVLMSIFTQLVFWIITFVIFLFIYKFIPKHDMSFKGQIYGAVFGSIALNVISFIFSKYLYIFKGFSLTYGSLTTLMLIMMWTYACFYTVLLGAEINKLLGIMHKD